MDGAPPRPGLRTIQINKCPVLVPMASLRNEDAQRLGIDVESTRQRVLQLTDWLDETVLDNIIKAMTREWPDDSDRDVDGTLYTGNFLSQSDKQRLATIRGSTPDSSSLSEHRGFFDDKRLDEIVSRYLARNFPDRMSAEDTQLWREHCIDRLTDTTAPWLNLDEFDTELADETAWTEDNRALRESLADYGKHLRATLGIEL